MKKILLLTYAIVHKKSVASALCFLLVIIAASSCSKTSIELNNIVGKWYIISDDIPVDKSGVETTGGGLHYTGTSNDYYHFTADGILYLKEGQNSDTATYLLSNDRATITYYPNEVTVVGNANGFGGLSGTYLISGLTPTTMTLTTSFPEQGGEETEIINLKR